MKLLNDLEGELSNTLSDIRCRITSLKAYDLYSQNLNSPAISIPPELLSRIFEFACHSDFTPADFPHKTLRCKSLRDARNRISLVCRFWRDVALETSSLWSSIGICRATMPFHRVSFPKHALLPLEVRRSNGRSLDLRLHVEGPVSDWDSLAGAVTEALPHCGLLDVCVETPRAAEAVLRGLDALPSASRLTTITLLISTTGTGNEAFALDLSHMPAVRNLWLECPADYSALFVRTVPPSPHQIAKLTLRGNGIEWLSSTRLIEYCQGLELLEWSRSDAAIYSKFAGESVNVTARRASKEQLRSLSLAGEKVLEYVATYLDAPILERLCIAPEDLLLDGTIGPLVPLSPLSHPHLFPLLRHIELAHSSSWAGGSQAPPTKLPEPLVRVIIHFLEAHATFLEHITFGCELDATFIDFLTTRWARAAPMATSRDNIYMVSLTQCPSPFKGSRIAHIRQLFQQWATNHSRSKSSSPPSSSSLFPIPHQTPLLILQPNHETVLRQDRSLKGLLAEYPENIMIEKERQCAQFWGWRWHQ
ncbi:hypothetical protein DL93DRAFT_2071114 [Clavulina sp. PMI_390]|nr:hypothetical protein DL93DRAFT_2071114 [Clavulina sp. PMI_390]